MAEENRLERLTRDLREEIEFREREAGIAPLRTALSALDPQHETRESDDLALLERDLSQFQRDRVELERELNNAKARADHYAKLLEERDRQLMELRQDVVRKGTEPDERPGKRKVTPPDETITVEQVRDVIQQKFGNGAWFQRVALAEEFPGTPPGTLVNRINELVERGTIERNGLTGRAGAMRFVKPAGGGPTTRPEGASTSS